MLILNKGGIAQFGTPDEIVHAPKDPFVQDFILNQLEIKRNNIFTLFDRQPSEGLLESVAC